MRETNIINNLEKPFVAYRSSAGSGKTFTLVKEYLRLLLFAYNENAEVSKKYFARILALTFTNKAANEMRERIIKTLEELSGVNYTENELLKVLTQPVEEGGTGMSAEEIHHRAKNILKKLLHNFNNFNISTIDKFTLKVVNAFATDLQLPLHYEIYLDKEELLERSIDLFLQKVGRPGEEFITENILKLIDARLEDDKSWRIENDLINIAKELLDFSSGNKLFIENITPENFLQFNRELNELLKQKEKEREELLKEFHDLLNKNGLDEGVFSGGHFPKYINRLLSAKPTDNYTPGKTILEQIENNNFCRKNEDEHIKQTVASMHPQLCDIFRRTQLNFGERMLIKEIKRSAVLLPFLSEVDNIYQQLKVENQTLTLEDFNRLLYENVKNEPTPFIYERIGERYKHFLIDEFQDTSLMQWHNLLPLVENGLAENLFNLIVGDAKQAIYRFRGGEVEQFTSLPGIYKHQNNPVLLQQQATIQRTFKEEHLDYNYRTGEVIVNFNNHLFSALSKYLPQKYQTVYDSLQQKPVKSGGAIKISVYENSDNNFYEDIQPGLLNDITELLNQGFRYKDIAILFRNNKEAKQIAQFLNRNNIPVISAESLLVFSLPTVKLIYYFFNHLVNPSEKEYQYQLLFYFYLVVKNYNDEEANKTVADIFYDADKSNPVNPLQIISDESATDIKAEEYKKMPVFELFEECVALFNLDKSADNYLYALSEIIYAFSQKKALTVSMFVEWFEDKKDNLSVNTPENSDAVTISTLHKAKGLEYPVVIFPYKIKDFTVRPTNYFWLDISRFHLSLDKAPVHILKPADFIPEWKALKEEENGKIFLDEINNLYVALTRPKHKLIWYINKKEVKNDSNKYFIAHEVEKMITDLGFEKSEENIIVVDEENEKLNIIVDEYHTPNWSAKINAENKEETQTNTHKLNDYPVNNWFEKIKIAWQAPDYWDVNNPKSYTEYGKLLHKLLSEIINANDFEQIIEKYQKAALINEEEAKEIRQIFAKMMQNPQVKEWFNSEYEVLTEPAILLPEGETFRPDRIIKHKDETLVIDFKTGESEAKHKKQVLNYMQIMQQLNFPAVKGYLLYLPEVKVEQV